MSLVATVGSASANSYVTLAEANTYFGDRLNVSDWDDAGTVSPPTQEAALITAALRLEQETYRGYRHTTTQALAWPRSGVVVDGVLVATGTIPTAIKRAQMKLALAMLAEDLLVDSGLEPFARVRVGPLEVEMRGKLAGALPADVRRELRPVLYGSPLQFRIERA